MKESDTIKIKEIEHLLFKSDATAYNIEKVTDIKAATTSYYRQRKRDYMNMTLKTAQQYQAYYNMQKEKE